MSTSLVVDWLKVRGVDVCIINEDDEFINDYIILKYKQKFKNN
jgi:hypothetical protein